MKRFFPLIGIALLLFSCKKSNNNTNSIYNLPNVYSNQPVGTSSQDLLRDTTYQGLNIEIQYMLGYMPDSQIIVSAVNFLNSLCNKPTGINIKLEEIPTQNKSTMTLDDIMLLEKQYRNYYTSSHNIWIYVLVTNGYSDSTGTLGMAYRNTSICLFGKNISDSSGNFGQIDRAALEVTVFNHELGHLLGLVNEGTPMLTNHQDPAHGNHCNNPHCLMYYQAETSSVISSLLPNTPLGLDSNCVDDLIANGAK